MFKVNLGNPLMDTKATNVLLVEDDPVTRKLVRRILTKSGQKRRFSLETATNLSNAIEHLNKTRFDIVLLDLDLPDSSGRETVVRIYNSRPDVSIVVLTGNANFEMQQKARNRRADAYLIKSTDVWKSLVLHIRDAIERKKGIETLKNGGQYLRSILDGAPVALIYISTQGRILEFNAQARKLWNCDKKNVLGRSFLDQCVPQEDRFRIYTEIRKALKGKSVKGLRTPVTLARGQRHFLSWKFQCIKNNQSQAVTIIAVAHDVSKDILTVNRSLTGPRLIYDQNFNDTVNIVLACLKIRKIESIYKLAGAEMLKKIMFDHNTSENALEKIPSEKISAVERLVLSLLASGHDKPDHLN